jgi:hypothetical protein
MNYLDTQQLYFGRGDILNVLNRRVADLKEGYRQNVALLGNRFVGKSTVLYRFAQNLDDELTVVYLDLENRQFDYFVKKFIASLLYNFARSRQLALHHEIDILLEATKEAIPHTVSVIHKILKDHKAGKSAAVFQGVMALPEVYTNETGKFCVLIIDEFQNIGDYNVYQAFQVLGKKIMTQTRCLYVCASSQPQEAQRILGEKLSLLFGNFEVLGVECFDLATSQDYISHRLRDLKIGAGLKSFLTDFTGGHPLYLDLICRELINLSAIHRQAEAYLPLLSLAVENTIFDRWGVLSRHFELLINELCAPKDARPVAEILMSMANAHHTLDEIASDTQIRRPALVNKMKALIECGIVFKNGRFHYYSDKLFKYWIKYVFQKRLKDIELSPDGQRKQFKDEFQRHVENFKVSTRQDFSSRIVELLTCFDNESFQLNGRKYRLPAFREIVPFKMRQENGFYADFIKAKTDDATWIIIMKKDNLSEPELRSIMQEARKIENKPGQCLIISLKDLDDATRLRALQERFWIWNEGELNALLTFFDKPYILK